MDFVAEDRDHHPVDLVEAFASDNNWAFERCGDDEIGISVAGRWTDYHASFSWIGDFEALHLACAFDLTVPESRSVEILRLISRINEQLLFGHFDFWENEGAIMYRHTLLFCGGAEPTGAQIEIALQTALETCESYYQAFQFVIWSNANAAQALETAMFETVGTA